MTTRLAVPSGGVSTGDCTSTACTIARAINQAVAGDTIEMANGTYSGAFGDSGMLDFFGKNGSNGSPILVRPATGATVTIRPDATTARAVYFRNCSWIELRDLIIDGTNLTGEAVKATTVTSGATDILLLRCEIKNATTMGVLTSDDSTARLTLRSCTIKDNGTDTNLDHNIYLATSSNIVEDCEISGAAAYGIHLYGSATMDNNIFRRNWVHNNGGPGIGIFGGSGNLAYNNVVTANGDLGIRVRSYEVIDNCGLYNNTVYGNGNWGIYVENVTPPNITNVHVRNNISYNNTNGQIITNSVSGTVGNNLTTDPTFVNAAGNDFRIQTSSAAKDMGTSLSGTFTTDKDGIARPQGATWDIGAYEFIESSAITPRLDYRMF